MIMNFKHLNYISPILISTFQEAWWSTFTALDEVGACYVNPGIQLNKTHTSDVGV